MHDQIEDRKDSKYARIVLLILFLGLTIIVIANHGGKKPDQITSTPINTATLTPFANATTIPTPTVTEMVVEEPQLTMTIDKMIEYTDRYFVEGHVSKTNNSPIDILSVDFSTMKLFDSTGNEIGITPIYIRSDFLPDVYHFSFYTENKGAPGNFTLVNSSLKYIVSDPELIFNVDFSTIKQKGGKLNIEKNLNYNGHHINISTVELDLKDRNRASVVFSIGGDKNLLNVRITDIDDFDYRNGSDLTLNPIISEYSYYVSSDAELFELFNAPKRFKIDFFTYIENTDLKVTWLPKNIAIPGSVNTSEFANICVPVTSLEDLKQTAKQHLPEILTGNLIIRKELENGKDSLFAKLSFPVNTPPIDFQTLTYFQYFTMSDDGKIYAILDKPTGIVKIFDSSNNLQSSVDLSKYHSDNLILAIDDNYLYFIDDYSSTYAYEFRTQSINKIIDDIKPVSFADVIPIENGTVFLLGVVHTKAYGGELYSANIKTGKIKILIDRYINVNDLTHDETKIIYDDQIIDTESTGMLLSNFDGTQRRLVLYLQGYDDWYNATFSPDGKWIIFTTWNYLDHSSNKFLLNLSTCDYYHFDIGDWYLVDWVE